MDGEPILKKTLVTMAAMVGACVAFVGTLSVVAVFAVTHAVGGGGGGGGSGSGAGAAPGAIDAPAATHAPASSSGAHGGAKAATKTSQEI